MLANNKTKTDTFVVHFVYVRQFAKLLKQKALIFFADADSRILNLNHYSILFLHIRRVDLDKAILRGKFQSVLDKIDEYLLQTHLVSINSHWHRLAYVVDQVFALHV